MQNVSQIQHLPSSASFKPNNQSFAHTNASRVSGEREVRFFPSILLAQLKSDSEDTVLTEIAKKSLAIGAKIG